MQGPTHILAGVIVNRLFKWRNYQVVALGFVFVISIFLHGIFDKLARVTYHPPNADLSDPFWLIYHTIVWLSSIVLIYVFWRDYKWGIIFSLLPDLDWVFIHGQSVLHIQIPFYQRPWMHDALNYILDNVVPFNYLNYLPDNRLNPWACLWEVLFVLCLALVLRGLFVYRKNIHFK